MDTDNSVTFYSIDDLCDYDMSPSIELSPSTTLSDVIAATIQDNVSFDSVFADSIIDGDNSDINYESNVDSDDAVDSLTQYLSPTPIVTIKPLEMSNVELPKKDFLQSTSSESDSSTSCAEMKYEPTTPISVRTLSSSSTTPLHNYSPSGDSRFNDSLTGLLGSPPPDSPLANNPFFSDLQAVLANDIKFNSLPESLLYTMTTQPQPDVFQREQQLQSRFSKLEANFPRDITQLSSFYRYQAALVETERFRTLHEDCYSADYKKSLNLHYDTQLHQIMDRVERSVTLLEDKDKQACRVVKPRPLLSKRAVKLMEDWYKEHLEHPYPNSSAIEELAEAGKISIEQVKKWFANKRNRSNNTRTLTEIAKKKRQISLAL